MAHIEMHRGRMLKNFDFLRVLLSKRNIEWAVVTKLLCGDKIYLKEVLKLGFRQICDSRVSNLKAIKQLDPSVETIYIKPPAHRALKGVVQFADISFNTDYDTIRLLSDEAIRQNKIHKIIIMLELGELREGVMRDEFVSFYEKVFKLPGIDVIGIGTNLNCLNGILPNEDKLIQLSLYKQLIEARFNRKMPLVSGGSSVTVPMLIENRVPVGINHFRIGEALFFGKDLFTLGSIEGMETEIFRIYGQIIELYEKPMVPDGEQGVNVSGDKPQVNPEDIGKTSFRAIIDLGLLDVDVNHITPCDEQITFAGASSDMIVLELGENPTNYKVGDMIPMRPDYMGVLKIMNSYYIEKRVIDFDN